MDPAARDAAATAIQARVRGCRARSQRRKVVAGVTKLQARQRGRFTRRAFAQLLAFSREQEGFLQAAKRRQLRIARHEQELYFLQHTTAETLERIRGFQRARAARAIQRTWRRSKPSSSPRAAPAEPVRPRDRILGFDPFECGAPAEEVGELEPAHVDPRSLEDGLLGPLIPSPLVTGALDREAFATRRSDAHDRVKQLVQSQKTAAATRLAAPDRVTRCSSPTGRLSHRRELYDQLRETRAATARRVAEVERTYRASRSTRELLNAKLASSCANRLKLLQDNPVSVLPPFCASASDPAALESSARAMSLLADQTARFEAETEQWDAERKAEAWSHHIRLVRATLRKDKWWQTNVAGREVDIRRVHALSPWDHERQVWSWPKTQDTPSPRPADHDLRQLGDVHSSEIDAFVFSLRSPSASTESSNQDAENTPHAQPMSDDAASEWWRAHCRQSHLPLSFGVDSSHAGDHHEFNNDDGRSRWSAEAVANPVFHRLYVDSQRRARKRDAALASQAEVERFEKHVNQRVCEVEMQIEENTKLQQDVALRRLQLKKRRTREENAAATIQRVYRGAHGRKLALEFRAEFFVMVRGRAIRKGKCEECGEQQAVLACHECEESLHFCPVCWVQVHSTRRRKLHRAIPMSVVQVTPQSERNQSKSLVSSQTESSRPPSSRARSTSIKRNEEVHPPSKTPAASTVAERPEAPRATRATRADRERQDMETPSSVPIDTAEAASASTDSTASPGVSASASEKTEQASRTPTPKETEQATSTLLLVSPEDAPPTPVVESQATEAATTTTSPSIDTSNEVVSQSADLSRADDALTVTLGEKNNEVLRAETERDIDDGDANCPPPPSLEQEEEIAGVEFSVPVEEEAPAPSVMPSLSPEQEESTTASMGETSVAEAGSSPRVVSEETPASVDTVVSVPRAGE